MISIIKMFTQQLKNAWKSDYFLLFIIQLILDQYYRFDSDNVLYN